METRKNGIPSSQEAVRQRILLAIHKLENETNSFANKFLNSADITQDLTRVVNHICDISGMKLNKIEDINEFESLLQSVSIHSQIKESMEFTSLIATFSRAELFEKMANRSKCILESIFKDTQRYCLSFVNEAGPSDCRSVSQYETSIARWTSNVTDQIQTLDEIVEDTEQFKSPFRRFVKHYNVVLELYEAFCDTLLSAMDLLKKWVLTDAGYAAKLQMEISECTKIKLELRTTIQSLEYEKERLKLRLGRGAWKSETLKKQLGHSFVDSKHFKRHTNKKSDFSTAENPGLPTSLVLNSKTAKYNFVVAKTEHHQEDNSHKTDIRKNKTTPRSNRNKHEFLKEMDNMSNEFEKSMRDQVSTEDKIDKFSEEIQKSKQELKSLESRVLKLKRIKEIKLSSNTMRKLHKHGFTRGPYTESQDDLARACHLTAVEIGTDWTHLYCTLPFTPPRHLKLRSKDVTEIVLKEPRTDPSFRVYAQRSLDLWRELSSNASVLSLVAALKRIKRSIIARKIEQQLLTVVC